MVHLASFVLRLLLGISCLVPFVWTLGNFLSSYQVKFLSFNPPRNLMKWIEGLSENLFVLMFAIYAGAAITFWHIVFWPLITGRKNSRFYRALSKATDYIWYAIGASVVVLIFNDFQVRTLEESTRLLTVEANRLRAEWLPELEETRAACESITVLEDNARDGVEWAKSICKTHIIDKEDFDLYEIEETCVQFNMDGTYYPTNDPRFWNESNEPNYISDSLNQIHYYCYIHVRYFDWDKKINSLKSRTNRTPEFPTFEGSLPDPRLVMFYLAFFNFALGAKLSKTTVDVVSELRKDREAPPQKAS